VAEQKAIVEAAAIENWGSKPRSQFLELQQPEPPKETFLSNLPLDVAVAGRLKIL
jgi:hypothetical protein